MTLWMDDGWMVLFQDFCFSKLSAPFGGPEEMTRPEEGATLPLGGSCGNKTDVSDASESAVICSPLLFGQTWQQRDLHSFSSPPVPCQCAKFIFSCTQRLIGPETASEKQFVSNYRKSLASVKVHSITPFLCPSPQFHNTGPDPVRLIYLFNLLIYFHGTLNLICAVSQGKRTLKESLWTLPFFFFPFFLLPTYKNHEGSGLIISLRCKVLLENFRSWQSWGCWLARRCPPSDGFQAVH